MTIMLAEDLTGWGIAALLFFGGAFASLLALGALVPASRGKRRLTITLIAPAIIIVILTTCYFSYIYTLNKVHDHEEVMENYVHPWLIMAGPALVTSLLTGFVLWLNREETY